jgi:hypothetical protein
MVVPVGIVALAAIGRQAYAQLFRRPGTGT